MKSAKAVLIAVSAAAIVCSGCFFSSPENARTAPNTACATEIHQRTETHQREEQETTEFPAAPPGALDREVLARAEWVIVNPFVFPVMPKSEETETESETGDVTIFGQSEATEAQMTDFILRRNPTPSLACSVEELVALYYEEAGREGIRADIALCQACKETGFFRYGGDVSPAQNNYCGLGATGNHEPGASFPSPALGVRAHIQHLLAYATERRPETAIVDPRYEIVIVQRPDIHGRIQTWTGLGGTWAVPGTYYGQDILNLWRQAKAPNGSPESLLNTSEDVRRAPGKADAYVRRAAARFNAGEAALSIPDYDMALLLAPSAEVYYNRALAYEALGDGSRAEEDYTKAVILNPKFPQPWYNRGRVRLLKGDYPQALADFAKVLELVPELSDAKAAIGVIHAKQGDYEAAWSDFYTVTHSIHDNNETALANQKILMDAVVKEKTKKSPA